MVQNSAANSAGEPANATSAMPVAPDSRTSRATMSPDLTWSDLQHLTPARVGLGRVGSGLPTGALLAFTLDHARARDAVHTPFDVAGLVQGMGQLGLQATEVRSRAVDRKDYLRRPDLGRMLDIDSQHRLSNQQSPSRRLAIVVADGLSPSGVNRHAVALIRSLIRCLAVDGIDIGGAVVASGARVALGDEIGNILGARMLLMLIGERPGLSTPDSLGAYLTFGPRIGLTDAERNCVSNIHTGGLGYDEAAARIAWLVREGLSLGVTGVALKDQSGGGTPQRITASSDRHDKSAI